MSVYIIYIYMYTNIYDFPCLLPTFAATLGGAPARQCIVSARETLDRWERKAML